MNGRHPLLFLLVISLTIWLTQAADTINVQNITIDDQFGDVLTGLRPVYNPPRRWETQACNGCKIVPNTTSLFHHTYTAATLMPDQGFTNGTIDFTFQGTAIYIFFTLFNYEGDEVTVNTECNFTIDGEQAGYFNHTGDPNRRYERDYQVLAFNKTDLEQKPHQMTISMSGVDYHTYLNFDYAMYTQESIPPTPSGSPANENPPNLSSDKHKPPVGAIVGGTLGGICFVLLLICFVVLWLRRRLPKPEVILLPVTKGCSPEPTPTVTHNPLVNQDIPQPLPMKARLVPRSPPGSIHGGSTVYSDRTSNLFLPAYTASVSSYSRRTPTATSNSATSAAGYFLPHAPNTHTSSVDHSHVSSSLVKKVQRMREEIASLRKEVAGGQLAFTGANQPLPASSSSQNSPAGPSR